MDQQTGKWIIITGVVLVIAGLVIWLFHDKLHWIGRLPGDIRVEREHFRFYFPLTTMILFSLVVTLLIYLFKRFF